MSVGVIVEKKDGRSSSREEFLYPLYEGDMIEIKNGTLVITNGTIRGKDIRPYKSVKIILVRA